MPAASVKIIKILEKYISIVQILYMKPEQKIIMASIALDPFSSDAQK